MFDLQEIREFYNIGEEELATYLHQVSRNLEDLDILVKIIFFSYIIIQIKDNDIIVKWTDDDDNILKGIKGIKDE